MATTQVYARRDSLRPEKTGVDQGADQEDLRQVLPRRRTEKRQQRGILPQVPRALLRSLTQPQPPPPRLEARGNTKTKRPWITFQGLFLFRKIIS